LTRADTTPASHAVLWSVAIVLLLACRVPSVVEPAGADQSLYAYVGQQINAGRVAYLDAWDQKPPAIHFIYAAMWRIWPSDSVVAAADLCAAALIAWLLVVLGSRLFGRETGLAAAALFVLLGNPAIQRLSGVRVRSQCETFIALAMAVALVLLTAPRQRARSAILAGGFFGLAFWLKYNAAAYALPVALAAGFGGRGSSNGPRLAFLTRLPSVALGFALISALFLIYFAAHGALRDLWLATVSYNFQYSGETYNGAASALRYLAFPIERARLDMLWYLGGAGVLLLLIADRTEATMIAIAWIAAACVSVAINGARDLPQYFVQANPALALAGGAFLARLWRRPAAPVLRAAIAGVLFLGLWRVGDEAATFKLAGLPEAAHNTQFDLAYARGHIARTAYLERFQQQGDAKYVPLSSEALIDRVRATTAPGDRILVFGLAANVYVNAPRESASRFFWSRPVVVEFERGLPGYGSAGLLRDLQRTRPALVALQKHWGDEPPLAFFMQTDSLRAWLEGGYTLDSDAGEFAIWRRRS
jgi:hypothetical protein